MRKTTLAAALLATAVLLTGCGSEEPDNQVASGTGAQAEATTPSSAPASMSRDEKAIKFTQCLREQGLDVPDPEPGKGPMLKFNRESGVTQEKVQQAMEACKEFNPQGESGPNPQQEENGRKFAACMRENGVEKFPDPEPGQRGIMVGPGVGDDPDFKKAQETCQPIMAGKQK
ncbi:hypothetical protein [Kribbella sp. CA-247076]|uniref:hypothetical protein n=1 Tax=Kribbella sp. CA-247076 TaxID=3239941 RepID=UPI003D8D20AC